MIRKFIAAFMIIFFSATTVFAADKPIVLTETGIGKAPSNWNQRDSFAKTFARQAARMDALRKLAEGLSGVNVYAESTWNDEKKVLERDYIKLELPHDGKAFKLLEKNARQIGAAKFYFNDKEKLTCEVTMELIIPTDWNPAPTVSTK